MKTKFNLCVLVLSLIASASAFANCGNLYVHKIARLQSDFEEAEISPMGAPFLYLMAPTPVTAAVGVASASYSTAQASTIHRHLNQLTSALQVINQAYAGDGADLQAARMEVLKAGVKISTKDFADEVIKKDHDDVLCAGGALTGYDDLVKLMISTNL